MPHNRKSANEIHALKKSYLTIGDAIARAGRLGVVGTMVTYAIDSIIGSGVSTRMEAFAYSAALYTSSHLWLKLSEDFHMAAQDLKNPRKTLHECVSRPLEGFGAKLSLIAAFTSAYILGHKAADAEYAAQVARQQEQAITETIKHVSPDAVIPDSTNYGIRAGSMCQGEKASVIFNIAKQIYQVDCNTDSTLQPAPSP